MDCNGVLLLNHPLRLTDLSPTPLLQGEVLEMLIRPLLLPFGIGEGSWEGEVCRYYFNSTVTTADIPGVIIDS